MRGREGWEGTRHAAHLCPDEHAWWLGGGERSTEAGKTEPNWSMFGWLALRTLTPRPRSCSLRRLVVGFRVYFSSILKSERDSYAGEGTFSLSHRN